MGACLDPSAFMIQISIGPQPSPPCLLQRFCRLNPIQPFFAYRQAGVGVFVAVGVRVGVEVRDGVGVVLGVGV